MGKDSKQIDESAINLNLKQFEINLVQFFMFI
jgi:hypothetical protein